MDDNVNKYPLIQHKVCFDVSLKAHQWRLICQAVASLVDIFRLFPTGPLTSERVCVCSGERQQLSGDFQVCVGLKGGAVEKPGSSWQLLPACAFDAAPAALLQNICRVPERHVCCGSTLAAGTLLPGEIWGKRLML